MLSFSFQIYFQRLETQTKHKTKKKTKKKQQIFRIKLRKDRFRMFGSHSKSISTVPTWFKAVSVAGWYDPIWPIWPDSGWIGLVRCESGKKKLITQTQHWRAGSGVIGRTPRLAALDFSAVSFQLHRCFKADFSWFFLIQKSNNKRTKGFWVNLVQPTN